MLLKLLIENLKSAFHQENASKNFEKIFINDPLSWVFRRKKNGGRITYHGQKKAIQMKNHVIIEYNAYRMSEKT